jgi:3-oxoacyl-[acyl-carrier-protein] synthase II
MAALTALGRELLVFWNGICAGRSAISKIESFDTSAYKTHFGGEIKDFDPAPYIDARDRKRLDRFAQFALVATELAVEDSGIEFDRENTTRCGVILGSGVGGLWEIEEAHQKLAEGPSRLSPLMIPRMMVNAASGHVSIRYGLKGPISAVATACASASNAIGDSLKAIQRGDADLMITGGSEAAITPLGLGGFIAMRALSQRNECPSEASRPFDRSRDGFVLSEGAGVVVLEEYNRARRRGARIYAELLGFGSSSDGLHITAPDPEGRGAAAAMCSALRDACLDPTCVDYINAHGTATPLGDKAETLAIKRVFGEFARQTMISSTKSQLGHLLGASGGVELVVSALALYYQVAPPTINLHEPDPDCDLDYVPNEARDARLRFALSNSFGFGGHNACLVVASMENDRRRARVAA